MTYKSFHIHLPQELIKNLPIQKERIRLFIKIINTLYI